MGVIKKKAAVINRSRVLFFTTSPRSPQKLIPEISLLIQHFEGKVWGGKSGVQADFANVLSKAVTFQGSTSKKYNTLSARDRITRAPQSLGFVNLYPTIQLTEVGNEFINGTRPSEIFLRQLLKFQLPSPYHKETSDIQGTFWGKPYLELIRLIRDLEYLTPTEFKIFALQLTDYRKFDFVKDKILSFRVAKSQNAENYKKFIDDVFTSEVQKIYHKEISTGKTGTRESADDSVESFIKKQKQNMGDYFDACFRYLRYTGLFLFEGRSMRIATEKVLEVDYILSTIEREPVFINDYESYTAYLFDSHLPALYTDIRENLEDLLMRIGSFTRRELSSKTVDELKDLKDTVIHEKRDGILQEQEKQLKSYAVYQEVMDTYQEIMTDDVYDAPLFFEWNTWRAMTMLNGGKIKGNFKIDDYGKPVSTAQGNMPDIECDYGDFALSVEVTLSKGQRQYDSEGESVTRHYARLKEKTGKETYCLFIAEKVSAATWEHFFGINQIKNISTYGGKPRIVPLELDQFMKLVENSYNYANTPTPTDVRSFLQTVINQIDESQNEKDWKNRIQLCVDKWLVA